VRLQEYYDEGLKYLLNVFEIYKTPLSHYQNSFEKVCKYIKKELVNRIIETDEDHLKFMIFDSISKKGSVLFKNTVSKLENQFEIIEFDKM
jgi:hypothetical protein